MCIIGTQLSAQKETTPPDFSGTWEHFLMDTLDIEQEGKVIKGTIGKGEKINGKWNEEKNRMEGLFRKDKKIHGFRMKFKTARKELLVFTYWKKPGEEKSVVFKPVIETLVVDYVSIPQKPEIIAPADRWRNKEFEGHYKVTVTNIYISDTGMERTQEVYGTVGVRLIGKVPSGTVMVKDIEDKKPRLWEQGSGEPVTIELDYNQHLPNQGKKDFWVSGLREVDKIREYKVSGEAANWQLRLNVQMKLAESDPGPDDDFPWVQENINIRDIHYGKEYLLISELDKKRIAVGFKVEFIKAQ